MKTLLRSSRRLTSGPENALASRRQIRYSYRITSLLRWQVESALDIIKDIDGIVERCEDSGIAERLGALLEALENR